MLIKKQFFETTRGRIVALLRRESMTIDDLASTLGLTPNAVRAHITAMERDGLLRRAGQRTGATRPSQLFQLSPEVEHLLSRAYIPFLMQLVHVFTGALPQNQVEALMRQAGRSLGRALIGGRRSAGGLRGRLTAASDLMNQELGAVTHVHGKGAYKIIGAACPLAAVTGKHPAVCLAIETLLSDFIGAPVRECCDREKRPRCCFEVKGG